jgi:hypothetical protein
MSGEGEKISFDERGGGNMVFQRLYISIFTIPILNTIIIIWPNLTLYMVATKVWKHWVAWFCTVHVSWSLSRAAVTGNA